MEFFTPKKSSLFIIQQNGSLGKREKEKELVEFEMMTVSGRPFLGLTIPLRRFKIGIIIALILTAVLISRAAHLQIIEGEHYEALAEGNRVRSTTIVPHRGIVTDNKGKILIQNAPSFVLTMTIADIPDEKSERERVLSRVAELSGFQRTDIDLLITEFADNQFEPVPIQKALSYESSMRLAIETSNLPGFDLEATTTRKYTTSAQSLSNILGYVGKIDPEDYKNLKIDGYRKIDEIGKVGIERGAEKLLRGIPGKLIVEVDAFGNELAVKSKKDPIPGANLTLSIDLELQKFIEERLLDIFEKLGVSRASVVAIDPQSGSIRAIVGLPSYDSNSFAKGIDNDTYQALLENKDKPLFSRAISGEFPSGSTFKPFVAYAALKEGIVDEHTSFLSNGGISINPWFFPDWKPGGHGTTDVRKAIAESVNTYFYIIGGGYDKVTGLGVKRITDYARQFNFGEKTGIILPGEANGFLPSKEWKQEVKGERWYVGDTYNLSIGQGDLLVTPLQMAMATGMIANGGRYISPQLIEAVDGGFETDILDKKTDQPEFDPHAIQIIREGMRQTVTQGSGRYLSYLPIDVAGKTGTAQNIGNKPYHAWFTGFAPYKNPSLAVTILIEEGGEGSSVAVPLARDIFEWWYLFGD